MDNKVEVAWVLGGLAVPFLGLIWGELRSLRSLITGAIAAQAAQSVEIKAEQKRGDKHEAEIRALPCKNGIRCSV